MVRFNHPLSIMLFLSIIVFIAPLRLFGQHEAHGNWAVCGELPRGQGLAPGEHGLVDRFNNPWRPSPQLIEAAKRRSQPLSAGCGFRVDFEDVMLSTGKGFDDRTPVTHPALGEVTLGEVRRRTVCEVFDYLASVIQIDVVPDIIIRASQTDGSGFLAAAGPFFVNNAAGSFTGGTLYDHITTGIDPTPAVGSYDAMVIYDFGPWVIGGQQMPINSDWNEPSNGRIDLYSITLHEVTHALGFLSLIRPDGGSGINGAYSLFDLRLHNGQGAPLVDPVSASFIGSVGDMTSNSVYFEGSRCGIRSPVYSPAAFAPGSSMSHFDSYRSGIRYVMRYATSGGDDRRLTEEELQTLCDIGYTMRGGICSRCRPFGKEDTASTFSGVQVCVDVLANDVEPGGKGLAIDPGSVTIVSGSGSVAIVNNQLCYTPPPGLVGPVYINYAPASADGAGSPVTLRVWVYRDRSNDRGLDSGMIAYWPFDDGTANDASGNGHGGRLNGGPVRAPGVCGDGMRFDGKDDYILVPKSPLLLSLERMSLAYWIKFYHSASDRSTGNSIGNGSDDRPDARGFYTYTGPEEVSHFLGRQPVARGLRMPYDATIPLDSQEYVFVTFIAADDTLSVYRNGCLVGTTPRDGFPIARDWDWYIGWSGDIAGDSKHLEGYMDEIRLYNRAISHREILDLYARCGGKRGLSADPEALAFDLLRCPRRDSTIMLDIHNRTKEETVMNARLVEGTRYSLKVGTVGLIAPGESARIAVTFRPDGSGYFHDTLVVTGDCAGEIRIPLVGGRDSCGEDPAGGADLILTKSVSDTLPVVGSIVTYTVGIANSGPSDAVSIVVRDVVPLGINVSSAITSIPGSAYNYVTGDWTIPRLPVGDRGTLTITGRVDSAAPEVIVNCAELISVASGDLNLVNNKACAPLRVRQCARFIQGSAHIGRSYKAFPGRAIRIPVELDVPVDDANVTRLRISIAYDPEVMRPVKGSSLLLTSGTLLEDWNVIDIKDQPGMYTVELEAPSVAQPLRGAGKLISLTGRMYLGERSSCELPLTIELPGRRCDTIVTSAGHARIDSLCGINFRLIEMYPEGYALDGAAPNPFNPVTEIHFSLGLDGPTRLVVLDALGREVAVLADAFMTPGTYSVSWDASAFPSGLYYYRLVSGAWTGAGAMMLVK